MVRRLTVNATSSPALGIVGRVLHAQRGVEAHGIHVDGLRELGQARVRGGVDGLGEGVCGQPAARHAEHRRDERDGDEHEDDVRDHAPDPTVADRAYSGRVAAGVGLAGPVGGCRTPPSPPLGVSAATIAATASSTSSVTVSRSRSRRLIVPASAAVPRSQSSNPPQYSDPISTIGKLVTFWVCTRVTASNSSSRVPNPPGSTTKPWAYLTNIVLRAKK